MAQSLTVDAVYENGILRPLQALRGIAEHTRVKTTVEWEAPARGPLARFAGILSDDEARELRCTIEAEFERVDPDGW
jgi:predicted DNA-binding antitoxin AbrB/MazE fold protein